MVVQVKKLNTSYRIKNTMIGDFTYISTNHILVLPQLKNIVLWFPILQVDVEIHPMNGFTTHPMFHNTKKTNG